MRRVGSLDSIMTQVNSTMLVTLWVFIGIEGASVYSARAASRSDVGRATVIGFLGALGIYVLVSLLATGSNEPSRTCRTESAVDGRRCWSRSSGHGAPP